MHNEYLSQDYFKHNKEIVSTCGYSGSFLLKIHAEKGVLYLPDSIVDVSIISAVRKFHENKKDLKNHPTLQFFQVCTDQVNENIKNVEEILEILKNQKGGTAELIPFKLAEKAEWEKRLEVLKTLGVECQDFPIQYQKIYFDYNEKISNTKFHLTALLWLSTSCERKNP